jgi:hypothetical protein|nr:MAG TPA: Protein of unknown function (DUF669) [Caudoviricetes sp.]
MINWNFNENEVEERSFEVVPVGKHRVRVESAEETKSSKGNDMIKVVMQVSGMAAKLFHYIVFMPDNTQLTNTKLAEFWDSFGIPKGNLSTGSWVGKIGACKVKHEEYNGEPSAKVSYFLRKKDQDALPAWQEPKGIASVSGAPNVSAEDFVDADGGENPFA